MMLHCKIQCILKTFLFSVANWAIPLAAIGDFKKDPELISPFMTPGKNSLVHILQAIDSLQYWSFELINSFRCNHGNLTNKGYFKGVWSCFEMLIFLFLFFHIWFVLFFYNRFLFFHIWFVFKSKIFCNGQKSFWCQLSTRETYSG